MKDLVSVITPTYNSAKYIKQTIKSVQAQTYENWEMVIVDDCSTDNTCDIIREFIKADSRIRLIVQTENVGAAQTRNRAVNNSHGQFIAYLDADDIWYPEKLEKQVAFMKEKDAAFSCTSYEVITDSGESLNKYVYMLPKVDYVGFLTHNLLQTVGIMVDADKVGKEPLQMPDMRRRQDAATWMQILKAGHDCYGMEDVLAQYRRAKDSLSYNKFKAVKGTWSLYRDVEKLSLPFSCYCFARYASLAVWKRLYPNKNSSKGNENKTGSEK